MKLKPNRLTLRLIFLKDFDKEVYSFVVSTCLLMGILMGLSIALIILMIIFKI